MKLKESDKENFIKPRENQAINRAIKKYGSIDEVLKAYREGIKENGYKAIEKEMIPVAKYYGNVRDRTLLALIAFVDSEGEVLKEKEALKIRDSFIYGDNLKEKEEHYKLFYIFNALSKSRYIYQTAKYMCFSVINRIKINLNKYNALQVIKAYHEIGANKIPDTYKEEFIKVLDHLSIEITGCTPVEADTDELLKKIQNDMRLLNSHLREYKSMLTTLIEWTNSLNAMDLLPYEYRIGHKVMDEALQTIPKQWFKKSPEDADRSHGSIITRYEDVELRDDTIKFIKSIIKEYYGR